MMKEYEKPTVEIISMITTERVTFNEDGTGGDMGLESDMLE